MCWKQHRQTALLTRKPSPWPACGSDTAAEWLVTALKSPVCVRKRPRWLSSTPWVFPPGVPSVFIQETQIVAQYFLDMVWGGPFNEGRWKFYQRSGAHSYRSKDGLSELCVFNFVENVLSPCYAGCLLMLGCGLLYCL